MSHGYPSSNRQYPRPAQGHAPVAAVMQNGVQPRPRDASHHQYAVGVNRPVYQYKNNSTNIASPNTVTGPQNIHHQMADGNPYRQQQQQQQRGYSNHPNYVNHNRQEYPAVISPPSNTVHSPQYDQFTGIITGPPQGPLEFQQSVPHHAPFENEIKPTLPPKIPVNNAPQSNVPATTSNSDNNDNDRFSQGFYQRNNSGSSEGNSSVDDLIDRYMDEVSQLDHAPTKKMSQIRNEKKKLGRSSIVKELELELDSPPPYEELDNLPTEKSFPENEKSTYVPRVRPETNALEGSSNNNNTKAQDNSFKNHESINSGASSMKSAPYPIDDPVGEVVEKEVVPTRRSRRYTDELLEELKNSNISDPEQEDTAQEKRGHDQATESSKPTDPVEDFIKSRNDALQNYKTFSLDIQFKWAKNLLDAISNPQIVESVNVNGQRIKALTNPKDIKKNKVKFLSTSIKVLKKLSDIHNDPESQLILGDLYSGYTLPDLSDRDIQKGFEFYLKATKGKNANATYKTGCCLEHGMGCKRDITKCFYFYEKSALLGDPDGMCKLGIVYIKGLLDQEKSAQKSVYWLNKAILTNKDATLPVFILAKIHETDIGVLDLKPHKSDIDAEVVKELQKLRIYRDFKTALQLFLKAAKMGHTKSQSHLGYCYEYGTMGCSVDPRTSIYWYSKAAQKGDANAEMGLSGWYLTGAEGLLAQSDKEAYLWAKKASDKGLAKAEYAVGYFNEAGVGTVKNLNEAKKWYKIAASQGYSKAIKKLENWR